MSSSPASSAVETEVPEIAFAAGLPGFPEAHRFALVRLGGDDSVFSVLRCLDIPDLEFVVTPPGLFFPDFEPEIDDDLAERLALETADDAILLVIVTVAEQVADSTANLLGPVVINRHNRSAAQAILDPARYSPRARLRADGGQEGAPPPCSS